MICFRSARAGRPAMLARRPCQTCGVDGRRQRLAAARLYLVCDARSDVFLRSALEGGVDVVQLRCKHSSDEEIRSSARRFARACAEQGVLLIINDRPDLVVDCDADGVHVGQQDMPVAAARAIVGSERLVGLSTHSRRQIDEAGGEVDYIGVGPVHATPTKPGRPAVGLGLLAYAAQRARVPFFAIGGIDVQNVQAVCTAGASRVAVVRALTETSDPRSAARSLRKAITDEQSELLVGST